MTDDSLFVAKEPCPECGSRDNLARYTDGHAFCFGCDYYEPPTGDLPPKKGKPMSQELIRLGETWGGKRGITEETCKKLRYCTGEYQGQPCHVVNVPDQDGNPVAQKIRMPNKEFRFIGNTKEAGLVFQDRWQDGCAKKIVVTEGEIDALSVSQAQGNKYPVVSVPNGAKSAVNACSNAKDYLNSFPEIVFMFDMDEPGINAARECSQLFGAKASVAKLELKDANEMLKAGRQKEIISAIFNAQPYSPDGIVTLGSLKDDMKKDTERGRPWIFETLTKLTFGRRPGELYFFGAGSGIGKTDFFLQQIQQDITDGFKVAMFLLEQPVVETGKRLAGKQAGKRFHIPKEDAGWTDEELDAAVDAITANSDVYLYDHFGAKDWDTIEDHIRWLNKVHGVTDFYVDHLTALVAHADDERRELESVTASMSGICQELNVNLYVVSHLATPDGTPHEEGGRVMAKHFKGSRSIIYWAHFMFGFERNTQAEDPDERQTTTVRIVKDRFTGQSTGETFFLGYERLKGWLFEKASHPAIDQTFKDESKGEGDDF